MGCRCGGCGGGDGWHMTSWPSGAAPEWRSQELVENHAAPAEIDREEEFSGGPRVCFPRNGAHAVHSMHHHVHQVVVDSLDGPMFPVLHRKVVPG